MPGQLLFLLYLRFFLDLVEKSPGNKKSVELLKQIKDAWLAIVV